MEEQINILCVTCLSTDRHLVPVHKITALLHEIHFEELQESPGGVCWECRSILKKFHSFKNRAKIAQKTLLHTTQHLNIKSLTTLAKTNILLDYTYNFFSKTNCANKLNVDQEYIKEENVDPSDNFKDQVDDNLAKIDENLDHIDDTSLNDSLVKVEDPIKKPEKYESIYSEADVIENKYDELFGKQENFSQDEKDIFNVTNEKNYEIETLETKPTILPTRTVARQKKDGVRVTKKISPKAKYTDDKEFQEKFVRVVLSEEEMLRAREGKRNQFNFKKLPYKCESCVLGFTRKDTYSLHLEKKHDESIGDQICDVCCIRFRHKQALNDHKNKHYVVYRCRLCRHEVHEVMSAVNHCKTKHAADKPDSIHCSQCTVVFKTADDLEKHMQTEHTLFCDCGTKFKDKNNLRRHMSRAHSILRNFICDICKKTFKTKTRLETHMVSHSGNIAKRLAYCQQCNVQYKSIQVYRIHLKSSANHSEGYPCSECNKKFGSKVYLKQHYNFYHLGKSQYKCEVCNKLFISKWRFRNHKQLYHGLSRPRNHSCSTCGKKFFTSAMLRSHQFTHSDQRSFMCENCGDTFKQSAALYTHTRLVHKGEGTKKKRDC